MIALTLALTPAHAIECGKPVKPSELTAALDEAETEYTNLNEVAFRDKVNEAAGILLPCLADPLPPRIAAQHHRVMSLHLSMVGDDEGALAAVEAAKVADPEYTFADALLPPDHPIRAHHEAYVPDSKTRNVPEPRSGSIAFDGVNGRARPKLHPTVAQLFDEQGLATSTTYLGPRQPLPPYRAIPRQRTTLLIATGSALILSGATYGFAWAQRGDLFASASDPSIGADTLNAKRGRTNGLTIASGAFFGVAIGTGIGAALVGER